jgi:ammonia channel protein AmtB
LISGLNNKKRVLDVFYKNIVNLIICSLVFFLIGYRLSFNPNDETIKSDNTKDIFRDVNFLSDFIRNFVNNDYSHFLIRWSYCSIYIINKVTTTTILGGTFSGRATPFSYIIISIFVSSFLFPFITQHIWSYTGLFSIHNKKIYSYKIFALDISGLGPVHLLNGVVTLIVLIFLGPRLSRFKKNVIALQEYNIKEPKEYNIKMKDLTKPSDYSMMTLGYFFIQIGWFGLVSISFKNLYSDINQYIFIQRAVINLLLSSSSAGITTFIMRLILKLFVVCVSFNRRTIFCGKLNVDHKIFQLFHDLFNPDLNLRYILNSILAGLVSISAFCHGNNK